MLHQSAAVVLDHAADLDLAGGAPVPPVVRPVEAVAAASGDDPAAPAPTGCVTLAVDDEDACVVHLRGSLGRGAIARIDAVLDAVGPVARTVVVDLSRARTRDRRLLRLLSDVAARRRDSGHGLLLRGVHPDAVPALEEATLPETFLVYDAVCRASGR